MDEHAARTNRIKYSYHMVRNPTIMRFHDLTQRLLGTSARTGVLRVLLANPGQELTAREVARQAGVSHPQVLQALRLFESERLVRQRRFGRSSLWSADPEHFLAEHLAGLASIEARAWRELTERLEAALSGSGAKEAYLFGSLARGKEEPGSDIDVMVVFGSQRKADRLRARAAELAEGFQRRFGNELELVSYGPEDLRRGGAKRLLETARREGVRLGVGR